MSLQRIFLKHSLPACPWYLRPDCGLWKFQLDSCTKLQSSYHLNKWNEDFPSWKMISTSFHPYLFAGHYTRWQASEKNDKKILILSCTMSKKLKFFFKVEKIPDSWEFQCSLTFLTIPVLWKHDKWCKCYLTGGT